jgi:AraC family transcriptional regulator
VTILNTTEYGEEGRYANYVEARRHVGRNQAIAMVRFHQPAGDFSDPPSEAFSLVVSHCHARGDVNLGTGSCIHEVRKDEIGIVPAGLQTQIMFDGRNAGTIFLIDPGAIADVVGPDKSFQMADFGRLREGLFQDQFLKSLLTGLWSEAEAGVPIDPFYLDGMLLSIIGRLNILGRQRPFVAPSHASALEKQHMARITSFVEENIDNRLGLAELAALVQLSPFYFSRAFKRATGQTPHRFVLARRVSRARNMLVTTTLPLADIALATGFSSQSHMTTIFVKLIGTTPARLRREAMS